MNVTRGTPFVLQILDAQTPLDLSDVTVMLDLVRMESAKLKKVPTFRVTKNFRL